MSFISSFSKFINLHSASLSPIAVEGKYFSSESLCGGFLNDVLYDINKESCQIPCYMNNTFHLISSQRFAYCSKITNSISIDNDLINAELDTVIKQHRVINRIHYENQQSLNKGENTKLISELIEILSSNNNRLNNKYNRNKPSSRINEKPTNGINKRLKHKFNRRFRNRISERLNNGFIKRSINEYSHIINKRSKWYLHFIPQPIKVSEYGKKLSVHILLFDGGSRFVLKHQLPKTIEYLKSIRNEYSMFDMLKYHTIGHNSNPHYLALFYGYRYNEIDKSKNFHKLIFEEFKEENFITINANLNCDINETFHGENNYSGSDHNLNPPSCDSYYQLNEIFRNPRCLGDRQIHQIYFDYFKDALSYYHSKKQPVCSLIVLKDSHDPDLKSVPRVDPDLANYLKYLNDNGIMNKSVIFLTADHGMHYYGYYETPFGKIDHSLPLLFIIFPKSFTDSDIKSFNNLLINQNRFVTAFDIHKTLLDLAHLGKRKRKYSNKEGSSLFDEISNKRNCYNQRVTFGCSCRVGNIKLDNDSYGVNPHYSKNVKKII